MDAALTRLVWQRAKRRCEYCQLPQAADDAAVRNRPYPLPQASRADRRQQPRPELLPVNSFKGSDISSIDKNTRKLTPLFNPRRHKWATHFRWEGPHLVGRTAIGRVTVALLHINDEYRVELREILIEEGEFPPA